jgi:hypothetical protein
LVKGKRQIIDSTPVIANISSSSITGLVRKCRENVLKTVKKQDVGIAEKLGLKEVQDAASVELHPRKKDCKRRSKRPVNYWIALLLSFA